MGRISLLVEESLFNSEGNLLIVVISKKPLSKFQKVKTSSGKSLEIISIDSCNNSVSGAKRNAILLSGDADIMSGEKIELVSD